MKRLTKQEHALVLSVLEHFQEQANKAIREYAAAGVDETHTICGKALKYYKNAAKHVAYMIWNIDPNKKQRQRKAKNGTTDHV